MESFPIVQPTKAELEYIERRKIELERIINAFRIPPDHLRSQYPDIKRTI